MNQNPFTGQELLDYGLFYSRKEKEFQEKLEQLLESLDEDSDDEFIIEDQEEEQQLPLTFNEVDSPS